MTNLDDVHAGGSQGAAADRIQQLEDQLVEVRQQLWQARDAVIGATATAGSLRARNTELEMLIHQLRAALAQRDAEIAQSRSLSRRIVAGLRSPRRAAGYVARTLRG